VLGQAPPGMSRRRHRNAVAQGRSQWRDNRMSSLSEWCGLAGSSQRPIILNFHTDTEALIKQSALPYGRTVRLHGSTCPLP
jgi:hypothetical protein